MRDIDAETRLITLLGFPLGHSLSPLIHNTALSEQEINAVYLCMPVAGHQFEPAVRGLAAAGFMGSNVTIPHKERAYELVDVLSDQARAVGAVNTIVCQCEKGSPPPSLYGDNTDIQGFLDPLKPYSSRLRDAEMTILGSGGAARAVCYALLSQYTPSSLTLIARTPSKAEALARDMATFDDRGALRITTFRESGRHVRRCSLLVNTTPVGMHPGTDQTPWPTAEDFSSGQIVYDLIYNPRKTRLLIEAERRGATGIGGMEMLIGQAAASYVQWTSRTMPADAVRRALDAHSGS